jgi:hypothetical protein
LRSSQAGASRKAHHAAEGGVGLQQHALLVHQEHGLAGLDGVGQGGPLGGLVPLQGGHGHPEAVAAAFHPDALLAQPQELLQGHQAQQDAGQEGGAPGKRLGAQGQVAEDIGGDQEGQAAGDRHAHREPAPLGDPVAQVGEQQPQAGVQHGHGPEGEHRAHVQAHAGAGEPDEDGGAAHAVGQPPQALAPVPVGRDEQGEAQQGAAQVRRGQVVAHLRPGQGQQRQDAAQEVAVGDPHPAPVAVDQEPEPGRHRQEQREQEVVGVHPGVPAQAASARQA